jgi:hypothetical protein
MATSGRKNELSSLAIIAAGILLIATLACYAPWQKAQAEREAVAQFAVLEESIYVPPDATLLAEAEFSGKSHEYASAGVIRVYTLSRSCKETVAEYQEVMTESGWTVATSMGSCDQVLWLKMYMSTRGQFGLYAKPPKESPLAEEWLHLQKQYEELYYVSSSSIVWYENQ